MTADSWQSTRAALRGAADRFTTLLQTVRDPAARAIGHWSIGETAAHVHEVSVLNTAFATSTPPPHKWQAVYDIATRTTVDAVKNVNAQALLVQTERDPNQLAPLIHDQVHHLLDGTAGLDGDEPVAWLGGIKVPVGLVLGHMLSELFVHGYDIARAERRRRNGTSVLRPAEAPLIFHAFLLPLLHSPDVARFAGERGTATEAPRATCELRLRGSTPGRIDTPDANGDGPVDVVVSADAAAMWLVMSGRVRPIAAAAKGQVVVWGRRPWRLRRLMALLHTP